MSSSSAIHLQCRYADPQTLSQALADSCLLAAVDFGPGPGPGAAGADPRYLRVPLQPYGASRIELWTGAAPARHGREADGLAWSENGSVQFGALVIDEGDDLDLEAVSALAYARMNAFISERAYPHLLRMWNYLDAVTEGEGDQERYRRFCVGRVRGLARLDEPTLPAATCIGSYDGRRRLLVYWLASRQAGIALENPRQVSAYRYPRQYGPQSPSFARAMLLPAGSPTPLLLSGTASIVGHQTVHPGDVLAQLDEIFVNLEALRAAAQARGARLPASLDAPGTVLKVYVREAADLPRVAAALDARLGEGVPRLLLHAEVCRRELAVEIEAVAAAPAG